MIKQKVVLCDPTTQHNCPTVEKTDKELILRDDFGGMVRLTPKEWELLRQKMSDGTI